MQFWLVCRPLNIEEQIKWQEIDQELEQYNLLKQALTPWYDLGHQTAYEPQCAIVIGNIFAFLATVHKNASGNHLRLDDDLRWHMAAKYENSRAEKIDSETAHEIAKTAMRAEMQEFVEMLSVIEPRYLQFSDLTVEQARQITKFLKSPTFNHLIIGLNVRQSNYDNKVVR